MGRIVELALNGAVATCVAILSYKINTKVRLVVTVRPFIPKPYVAKFVLIKRIKGKVRGKQSFKLVSKVPV